MTPSLLKLWFSTRKYGEELSGNITVIDKTIANIRKDTGFNVSTDLSSKFTNCLKQFPLYTNTIYRGIFKHDPIYLAFLNNQQQIKLNRYYSCSKNRLFAESFGDKILLIISHSNNFDVSSHSREEEIILDKNQTLYFQKNEVINGYTIIYLSP